MDPKFPKDSNIMVVDDAESMRTLLCQTLKKMGYSNLIEASNGQEALDKVRALKLSGTHMQLMIVDWVMPVMTGIDLLSELRKDPECQEIPFLMIASLGEAENVIKAIVMGVNDFIVKPLDEEVLANKMASIWTRIQSDL